MGGLRGWVGGAGDGVNLQCVSGGRRRARGGGNLKKSLEWGSTGKRLTWIGGRRTPTAAQHRVGEPRSFEQTGTRGDGGPAMLRCGHSSSSSLSRGARSHNGAFQRRHRSGTLRRLDRAPPTWPPSHQSTAAPPRRAAFRPLTRAALPRRPCPRTLHCLRWV